MAMIALFAIALLGAATAGAALVKARQAAASSDRIASVRQTSDRWRERNAAMSGPPGAPRSRMAAGGVDERTTRLELQPAPVPTSALVPRIRSNDWTADDSPLGLTITALPANPIGSEQQDVYYIQRNTVALSRGLSATGATHRAATLTLSAMMTSPLGQLPDGEDALRRGVRSANRLVQSVSRHEPKHSDMAATLDAVFMAVDKDRPRLDFAHVGNGSIWLQRVDSVSVELLTETHTLDGGPPLRAVGISADLAPDTGLRDLDLGDRIFLTSASRYFSFTPMIMDSIVIAHASSPLHSVVAALAEAALDDTALAEGALTDATLADAARAEGALTDSALADIVRSSAAPEGVTIIAAEVTRLPIFQA